MLHGVQIEALKRSAGQRGFAFFMDMGLGKTLATLAEFKGLTEQRKCQRLVVFCPNSFKRGWKADAQKWGLDFDFFIWEAGLDTYMEAWMRGGFKKPPVLVINYEAIRSEKVQTLVRKFMKDKITYLAIDESIKLKNPKSIQTKAILGLTKEFDYVRVLSGKPQTQGPHDLWSQLQAIGAANGMNYYAFKTVFCKMGGYMNKEVKGAQNEQWLRKMLEPVSFYATKKDWAKELPDKVYSIRDYKQNPEVHAHYRQMEEEFLTFLSDTDVVAVDLAITKYMKMAQIQTGFIIDEEGITKELVPVESNNRINTILEMLEDEISTKVCIAYKHKHSRTMLQAALTAYGTVAIAGGMTPEDIELAKHRFNNDPDCRVILLQIGAAKYGHTLLGGEGTDACHTMIFFENSYSLDDRSQIEDRIHRHGQKNTCQYIDLSGTDLDTQVIGALQRKEAVYQSVFEPLRSRPHS